MKKIKIAACLLLLGGFVGEGKAQNDADLLRYSMLNPIGTARFNAMGGAFGALGANFTALSTNPAGIGFYTRHEISLTGGWLSQNASSEYYGDNNSIDGSRGLMPQGGGVFCFNSNYPERAWKFHAAFGANRLKDFNNNVYSRGINTESSYMESLALESSGYDFAKQDLSMAHWGKLAYQTGLLDYTDTVNFLYGTFLGRGLEQRHILRERGNITEMVFSFGGNWRDKLYFGVTLGVPIVNYSQEAVVSENDTEDTDVLTYNFRSYEYQQDMDVSGSGINLKLGLIYKPVHFFRVGVAFHTPTHYWLRENTTMSLETSMDYPLFDGSFLPNSASDGYTDSYEVITPMKGILSFGFLIKNFGAVAIEGELTDYRTMRLDVGDLDYESDLQSILDENYRLSGVVRVGTEWKFNILSIRAGYIWQSCPYTNEALRDSWYNHTATAGIGLTLGAWNLDFGFMADLGKRTDDFYYMVNESGTPLVHPATVKLGKYIYTLSLGFRF